MFDVIVGALLICTGTVMIRLRDRLVRAMVQGYKDFFGSYYRQWWAKPITFGAVFTGMMFIVVGLVISVSGIVTFLQ